MPTLRDRIKGLREKGRTSQEVKNIMEKAFGVKAEELIPYMDTEVSEIKSKLEGKSAPNQIFSSARYKKCDDNSLKFGCGGENVKVIQKYLSNLGYSLGRYGEDGKFGRITKAAVIKLQKNKNLPQTGVVDSETLKALESESEKTTKEQTPIPNESSSAESIQKEYRFIQNRYKKLENLVFERLVKDANRLR